MHTVEVCRADKGDVNAQVPVVGRTVKTQVNTQRHRRPGGILGAAIEADLSQNSQQVLCCLSRAEPAVVHVWDRGATAHLVCGLGLEFLKNLLRLRLGGRHNGRVGMKRGRKRLG